MLIEFLKCLDVVLLLSVLVLTKHPMFHYLKYMILTLMLGTKLFLKWMEIICVKLLMYVLNILLQIMLYLNVYLKIKKK